MSRNEEHTQEEIVINGFKTKVDSELVPLLGVLNSISGVETIFSCQGDMGELPFPEGYNYPYISFLFHDKKAEEELKNLLVDFSGDNNKLYCSNEYTFPVTKETFLVAFVNGKKSILAFQEFVLSKMFGGDDGTTDNNQ